MGLFNEVLGGLEAQAGQHAALFGEVSNLVAQSGGVNGLVQQFQQKGLGGVASGWVANGANPPITADQVIAVIGPDKVGQIAAKVGLTEPQVAEGLARLLPVIINHLTPHGNLPAATPAGSLSSQLEQDALGLLKSKLFG